MRKLEQAPEEHAEALLSAYDLLQRMHEKGLIELASGLLSASETVVDRARRGMATAVGMLNLLGAALRK